MTIDENLERSGRRRLKSASVVPPEDNRSRHRGVQPSFLQRFICSVGRRPFRAHKGWVCAGHWCPAPGQAFLCRTCIGPSASVSLSVKWGHRSYKHPAQDRASPRPEPGRLPAVAAGRELALWVFCDESQRSQTRQQTKRCARKLALEGSNLV